MLNRRPVSLVCLLLCLYVLSSGCLSQDSDGVEASRHGIQALYASYTGAASASYTGAASGSKQVDLIFVLDRSSSVTESGWLSVLRFVQNFLEHFTVDPDNARVAVISYSTTVSLDIDGVRSGQYNKCDLFARLQGQTAKKVPSGYSSTHDALLRAKDVALTSRADAKKAVIVITSGKSSIGPPPIRASVQLRSLTWDRGGWNVTSDGPQLQVYAFGVKDAYMPEVRSIASPLQNHSFYLPTFQALRKLARSLHDDSQSESWQVLDPSSCHGICDDHASCACGTRSGQHLCICREGYQGDGTACTACPRGTYKSKTSPSRCVPCPLHSTTLAEGAADARQCVCEPPFRQNAAGYECQHGFCDDLPNIDHGHKFHVAGAVRDRVSDTGQPCLNLPGSSCHFSCDVGYRLDGQPGLVCLSNGTWEGTVPSCHVVDCGPLSDHHQEPSHVSVEYVNNTTRYGSVVRATCDEGWRMFGDRERVCTQHRAWSGTQAWCFGSRCPALTLSPGLIITPVRCGQAALVTGDMCRFICETGYLLHGPSHVECTDRGTLDSLNEPKCVDIQPPSITCAADITTLVTRANFAVIDWESYPPVVTDNSREFIITAIGVPESNDTLRLTAGTHHIKYTARDKTGNEASCEQKITVLEFTVHLVTCPDEDVTINMTHHQQEAVWPEVVFVDHNNVTVAHKCVPANNTRLPAGAYTVTCVPDTQSFQQAQCHFRAIFRQPRCDTPPPPLHGNVSCSLTPTSLLTCTTRCQEGFDFFNLPQVDYICDLDGNWNLPVPGYFWPDCSRTYRTRKALLRGHAIYYYSGQCRDIKEEITNTFTAWLQKQVFEICGMETCSVEIPRVSCGEGPTRKRRSLGLRSLQDDKAFVDASLKHQTEIAASLVNLLVGKRTETISTDTSKEMSTEATDKVHNKKHPFLLNFSLDNSEDKISTEDTSQDKPHETAASIYPIGIIQNEHHIKRPLSNNYVLNYNKNIKISKIDMKKHIEVDTLSERQYQRTAIYENSYNKEQERSGNHKEEGTITRNLFQTENNKTQNKNIVNETNIEVINNKGSPNSKRSFKRIEEATGSSRSVEYGLNQEPESSLSKSAVTSPENSKQFLDINKFSREVAVPSEEDTQYRNSLSHTFPKGSVEGFGQDPDNFPKRSVDGFGQDPDNFPKRSVDGFGQDHVNFPKRSVDEFGQDPDNFDADYDLSTGPSGSSSSPSVDYFLENVTPRNFQDEDTDGVKIEFVITKEMFNATDIDSHQDELFIVLLDISARLDNSLNSYNLTVLDNNATSSSNGSDILYALSHKIERPVLDACDYGFVTHTEGSKQFCIACPTGSKYDSTTSRCLACDPAYYQSNEAQHDCLQCPNNTMTEFSGANNISMCLAMCNPGQFSGTGLFPCHPCPLHSYQPMATATTCLQCPAGRKTLGTGAVDAGQCLDLCDLGMYSKTGLVPCVPCQVGSYQPSKGATECLLCGDGLTTSTEQASNISACSVAWDACASIDSRCAENGGTCVARNNLATCVCALGFSGASCEINIPDCFESSCQNNGTCIDGNNNFTCDCLPGFTGWRCEVNNDECMSSPCQNGSSCLDLFNGYQCFCSFDYTGANCETKIHLCEESDCINGRCEEMNGTTACICSQGFTGSTCNMTNDLCSSHPCAHNGQCVSISGHFQCLCLPGFTGALCDTAVDPCENSNCSRESLCIPALSGQLGYLCKCHGGWLGQNCEHETTADFDLVFNANGQDGQYVVLPPEFMPSLVDFTVCTWLRPQSLSEFATIVAFTLPLPLLTLENNDTRTGKEVMEFRTIFSIKHTDQLTVNIFNHSISTNVTLTFLVWSHLCVTWSCASSHWQVVVNGSLSAQGTVDHHWTSLPVHAQVVLGQSNPYYAEASMSWKVFAGEITQFNIFSHVLSLDSLRGLGNGRTCNTTYGDVISWTDVALYTKGDLVMRETSHCLDINECLFPSEFPCGNNRECVDLIGSYNCSLCVYGYTGGNCDQADDECAMDKCTRGECFDGPEPYDFQCVCPPGVTGYLCDDSIDLCQSNPCQNGGTCNSSPNTFFCSCPLENMGPLCEITSDGCSPNPCLNHGICFDAPGNSFKCNCSENFTGRFCERGGHLCEDSFCQNGGVCQNRSVSLHNDWGSRSQEERYCSCINGWMGRYCEVRMVQSCDLSPCSNGGSCSDLPESQLGYICQCLDMPKRQVDENCEYLNSCNQSPCANNTLCVHFTNNTFICVCPLGHQCTPHESTSNTSDHGQIFWSSTEKISTSSSLSPGEIWTITAATATMVLLVVGFAGCIIWRRKYNRSNGEILVMSDVDEQHLTNSAFLSEEPQLEENIDAEFGDYSTHENSRTVEDFSSQGFASSSTTSSFSSSRSRSPLLKKPSAEDDYDMPLLSLQGMATSYDTSLVKTASTNNNQGVPSKLGVSNNGFDSENYAVSEHNRSRKVVGEMDWQIGNSLDIDTANEFDKNRYVNVKYDPTESEHSSNQRRL